MKIYLYEDRKDVTLRGYFPDGGSAGRPAEAGGRALPAVLICPGGGYHVVGTTEGRPVADMFTDAGYAAFILDYTVGDEAAFGAGGFEEFAPVRDLTAAMRLLHENNEKYGIDAEKIILSGFSAGGHLCAAYCFSGVASSRGLLPKALLLTYAMGGGPDSGGEGKPQPDFDVARMDYADDPSVKNLPVFFWHAKDDAMVPFAVSERLDARLTREGIPHTFLLYEHGVHTRPLFDTDWFFKALDWLAANGCA